ncbi:MAG: GNAT family N-acetyltransferase [Dehalococcoidia bacterium]|jgi:CelD/BcsL family acetyltransferase involved in cellulose biosynthesis
MSTTLDRRVQASRLTTLPEIDALRDEWRQLEERCPDVTPFSTWEWCGTVAKYYGGGRPFWVFALRDGDGLVGIAPFAETRLGGVRLLRFIGSALGRYSIADYQDLLAAEGREDEVVAAFCDELARHPGWDVLHLQEVPFSSRTVGRLVAGATSRGWLTLLQPGSDVYPLPIRGTWDSYKATLPRTMRKATSRKTRKLIAEQAASFSAVGNDEGAVYVAMEELFDLHTRRWRSVGRPGIFRDHRRRFHHEVASRFAQRGMLMISLLKSGDRTIAVKYGFQRDGVQYLYSGGFSTDPEWSTFGLGAVLNLRLIEDAFERGVRCVDWMRGDGHYKEHYRVEKHFNQDLLVFRNQRARLHYRVARIARAAYERLRRKLATNGKHPPKAD